MVTLNVATPLAEEPDALIALVRVCGGLGGQPPGLPGKMGSIPGALCDLLRLTPFGCGGSRSAKYPV